MENITLSFFSGEIIRPKTLFELKTARPTTVAKAQPAIIVKGDNKQIKVTVQLKDETTIQGLSLSLAPTISHGSHAFKSQCIN